MPPKAIMMGYCKHDTRRYPKKLKSVRHHLLTLCLMIHCHTHQSKDHETVTPPQLPIDPELSVQSKDHDNSGNCVQSPTDLQKLMSLTSSFISRRQLLEVMSRGRVLRTNIDIRTTWLRNSRHDCCIKRKGYVGRMWSKGQCASLI